MPIDSPRMKFRDTHLVGILGFFLCLLLSVILPNTSCSKELQSINKHIIKGGYALRKNGNTVFSKNLTRSFIPASTIKLVTSLAALEILGPDYRFTTDIFFNYTTRDIYIKGSGDPYLVSEKVAKIARIIAQKNITDIRNIVLDDSSFALEETTTNGSEGSTNPYDANCSALAVNFNSLPLKTYKNAKVKSVESQTPYLPLMGQIAKHLASGYHRVNVDAFPEKSLLSNSLLYSGQLFKELLIQQGIKITGDILQDSIPVNAKLLHQYIAEENLLELVQKCLLSSNNFMANQIFLTIGAVEYGFPATWKKSQKTIKNFIKISLGLTDKQLVMIEGSGLSKENKLSPEAMIRVLENFEPYSALIPIKYGTRMKSGTLRKTGVFCYAGYITKGNTKDPFVILLNQKQNYRDAILRILYRQ